MKSYLIVKSIKDNSSFDIAKFNIVSGNKATKESVEIVDDVYFPNVDNVELSVTQATRYDDLITFNKNAIINNAIEENEKIGLKKLDLNYIITGVETPTPEPTLNELKEAARTTLKTNMYLLIKDGHTYNGFVFNYDEDTTMNIIKQKNRYELEGGDLFKITDRTKTQRHFTKIELYEFGASFSSYIAPLEEQYSNANNNIEKATTETELEAVDLELTVEE